MELSLILGEEITFNLNNPLDTKPFPINTSPWEIIALLDSKTTLKSN